MNKIERVQYVSQGRTLEEQERNINQVLKHGCKWIQLRWKYDRKENFVDMATRIQQKCRLHHAKFIINDHVDIAKALDVDGVHLGLNDMPILSAREILGNKKIIGGTANTLENVKQRISEGCDYIGLGPFRFTTTKEALSPILGIGGYKSIVDSLIAENVNIPTIIAIGGIEEEDILPIKELGLYGVALSTTLTHQPILFRDFNKRLQ